MAELKYPIGIQSFKEIREGGYVYVDKTEFIHRLVSVGKYYFLSRPRRFGKSLLLSTIEAYYRGRRDLFNGLALDSLTEDWEPRPVMHLDLNSADYDSPQSLTKVLEYNLSQWEEEFGIPMRPDLSVSLRFGGLIRAVSEKSGKKVVILVDEYDKPMLNAIKDGNLVEIFRSSLKAFYGNLKSMDRYIEFAMLTGVARFSRLSIFSDLNNLRDISFEEDFSAICGITKNEVDECFRTGIRRLGIKYGLSYEEIREQLRVMYDGYHFAEDMTDVYNPFSLVNVFARNKLGNYWFQSGTPTHLVKVLQKKPFALHRISGFKIKEDTLSAAGIMADDPVITLFQSGYLTIKSYDLHSGLLSLDYPNREVKESFLTFLVPYYTRLDSTETDFAISRFCEEVEEGKAYEFMQRLSSLVSRIPYGGKGSVPEDHFQNAVYLVFTLMGYKARVEERISRGRIDMTVETGRYVYIFEFKTDSTARKAMDQIQERGYAEGFRASGKQIILVGANFDSVTKCLTEDIVIEEIR